MELNLLNLESYFKIIYWMNNFLKLIRTAFKSFCY